MKKEYKIEPLMNERYKVTLITTTFGERTSAYDSEHDMVEKESVFQGSLSDCDSYIRLTEKGYM